MWLRGALLVIVVAGELACPGAVRSEQPGQAAFKRACARCHGEGGKSDTPHGRPLKVAPLVNDARLANMTPAEIVHLVKTDPKHHGVVHLESADLEAAAVFVKTLARRTDP